MKITLLFMDQVLEIIPDFHGMQRAQNCPNFSMLNIQVGVPKFGIQIAQFLVLVLYLNVLALRTRNTKFQCLNSNPKQGTLVLKH